jgi:hypothetical protein
MYPEIEKFLNQLENELEEGMRRPVDLQLLNVLEHLLFECWSDGYLKGYEDRKNS